PDRIVGAPRRPLQGPDEGVLHHVFRVGRAAEHAVAKRPEKAPMLLVRRFHAGVRDVAHPTSTAIVVSRRPLVTRLTASAALSAAASESWPRGPTHSPASATLSNPASRDGGRPATPPRSAVASAWLTTRFGRNWRNSTRSRQPGCI